MNRLLAFGLCLASTTFGYGQTSFPMITHCTPTAIQRGTTAEITVEGQMNFAGCYKVMFEGEGLSATVVPPATKPADPKAAVRTVKLKVVAEANAAIGVREFRIASTLGISSLGQILVVDAPVITEAAGINTADKAQSVTVPCAICGRIEAAENVDYYKFPAKAGQTLTFEVQSARIQDKIHDLQKHIDPLIAVFDLEGRELVSGDDNFFADPQLTFKVPKDGLYIVQIRDSKYDGDPRWSYALVITDKPAISQLYPFAGNPGQSLTCEPTGSAFTISPRVNVQVPSKLGIQSIAAKLPDGRLTNMAGFVVTRTPLAMEVEPNDTPSQATPLAIPGGMSGRIQTKRDLDYYVFTGKKGQPITFEVFARRFGTPLNSRVDAVIDIMSLDGKTTLASNDDTIGKDPLQTFTPAADGKFLIRIRDLNNKGGDGFGYFLEATLAQPDFTVKCDPSKAMVGPGQRTAWYVQVARTNGFVGEVKVNVSGLPKGMTVTPLTIPANMTTGCMVLSADKDAKPDASFVKVSGTAEIEKQSVTKDATPWEEIYMPGGGRGRFEVNTLSAAITEPSDVIDVIVSTNKVTLKPGQEVTINVTIKRRADYDKTLTIDAILRHLNTQYANCLPPGVTMVDGKSKTLLGTGNAGTIVLKAAPDAAECTDVPVAVQAYVPINFVVKIGYSSEPILISVKK